MYLSDKCLKTRGGWEKDNKKKQKKNEGADSVSQPGGDIIEACNHRLLFPGFSSVQGPASMWGGVRVGWGGSWEADRQEEWQHGDRLATYL